jgi:hypothetical protein
VTRLRIISRALRYYWRTDLCIVLGLSVATAVIIGSLGVGDSMTASLRRDAERRLGNISHVLRTPHSFRASLADEIGRDLPNPALVTAVVWQRGSAQHAETDLSAARVTVLGVPPVYWEMFPDAVTAPSLARGRVALNAALASDIGAKVGDEVLLHIGKSPGATDDVLFVRRKREHVLSTMRLEVIAILSDESGGGLAFDSRTVSARNAFVDREVLAAAADRAGLANIMLASVGEGQDTGLDRALAAQATPADLGLRVSDSDGQLRVESQSIVLGDRQIDSINTAAKSLGASASASSVYVATRIAIPGSGREIAYAMIGALDDAPPHLAPGDDGIVLNRWAADDLMAKEGDEVELTYPVPARDGVYRDAKVRLTLRQIVDTDTGGIDRSLVPDLDGLMDVQRIEQWDVPFPIDPKRISERDDQYWDRYGPTPKAMLSPATMRRLWQEAGGEAGGWVTSMRVKTGSSAPPDQALASALASAIPRHMSPAEAGMSFEPVRERARIASEGSTDFGQLFLALSMFLVAAAIGLAGMLMKLWVEQRSGEYGTMLACGWTNGQVRRLALTEIFLLSLIGSGIGILLGPVYVRSIVWALNNWWNGPWGAAGLIASVTPGSIVWGICLSLILGMICGWGSLREIRRRPVLGFLTNSRRVTLVPTPGRWTLRAATLLVIVSAVMLALSSSQRIPLSIGFFVAGTCLLIAMLAGIRWGLGAAIGQRRPVKSLASLAIRSAAASPTRSLLTICLLACSSFILTTVAANRRDLTRLDVSSRASGTGGFTLQAITSIPLRFDPINRAGRANLGFLPEDEPALAHATIIALPSSPGGDDVSCLNLARPASPRLLGVTPELVERNAFSVRLTDASGFDANPWRALESGPDYAGVIPAFGDADSVMWILHSRLGDVITFDGPGGQPVKLRIAGVLPGSIFAGELLVSEANLRTLYPGTGSPTHMLVETAPGEARSAAEALRRGLAEYGVEVRETRELLASFAGVQNLYLSIFLTLGGLGMVLGVVGLAIVIARGVIERRGELAMMSAGGFSRSLLVRLLAIEHAGLALAGLLVGTTAALVATAPALLSSEMMPNWSALSILLAAVAGVAILASGLAAHASVAREPSLILREE